MTRRDLLQLRVDAGTTVVELDCARLYLRYLDTRRPDPQMASWDDHYLGEPERVVTSKTTRELFDGLRDDLVGADVLRVVGPEWLADADVHREVVALVIAVRAKGGRVELSASAPPGPWQLSRSPQ